MIRSDTLAVSDRIRHILISRRGLWFWTGAPRFATAYVGQKKTGRSPFPTLCYAGKLRPRARVLAHGVKAFEESVFGPCTLGRTWGTRPGKRASFFGPPQRSGGTCCSGAERKAQPPGDTLDIFAAR